MDGRSILIAFIPVVLTLVDYAIVRDLLWGILLGNKSKKSALKLKAEAEPWGRFTQNYMTPYITKYLKDFKTWKGVKLGLFLLTVAQIIAFVLLIVLKKPFWLVALITGVIVIFDIVVFSIMMSKTQASDNKHNRKGSPWKFEQ
ncbi:MAG: hypothetical protein J5722_10355 [Oscillospiraceae bacterium]|nr:hypothetical protein [Oscillospiraceae bacterium]